MITPLSRAPAPLDIKLYQRIRKMQNIKKPKKKTYSEVTRETLKEYRRLMAEAERKRREEEQRREDNH